MVNGTEVVGSDVEVIAGETVGSNVGTVVAVGVLQSPWMMASCEIRTELEIGSKRNVSKVGLDSRLFVVCSRDFTLWHWVVDKLVHSPFSVYEK